MSMTIDEQIEILLAKKAGKRIEVLSIDDKWVEKRGDLFDFAGTSYRIAKEPVVRWMLFNDAGSLAQLYNSDSANDNRWDHKLKITFHEGQKPEARGRGDKMNITEAAKRSEELINELEDIYLSGPWRSIPEKVKREKEIKEELSFLMIHK